MTPFRLAPRVLHLIIASPGRAELALGIVSLYYVDKVQTATPLRGIIVMND